ncbi:MAG: hypothetical protein ABR570_09755 [Burkholderiales bacterium]
MKNLIALAAAVGVCATLAGCDTTVTKQEMETADYGPKPGNYQDEIRSYLKLRLTDPKDAIVEFRTEPKQLYQRGTPVRGEQYGWGVCVWVNDKNKQGAYEGFFPMSFILRNEKIVAVNGGPDDANIIGAKYAREHCERLGAPFKQ